MATKKKTTQVVKTKQFNESVVSISPSMMETGELAIEYKRVQEAEAGLKAHKDIIRAEIVTRLNDEKTDEIETQAGKLMRYTTKKYKWTLDDVKSVFGRSWTQFVQPDAKTLRAKMETKDIQGCALESIAQVSETINVTVK